MMRPIWSDTRAPGGVATITPYPQVGIGFWVLAEETRDLTEDQLDIIEQSGFSYWYTKEKAKATIDYALGS